SDPKATLARRSALILDGLCLHVLSIFQGTGVRLLPSVEFRPQGNLTTLRQERAPVNCLLAGRLCSRNTLSELSGQHETNPQTSRPTASRIRAPNRRRRPAPPAPATNAAGVSADLR